MPIDAPTASLIASLLAALVSIITFFVSLGLKRQEETRLYTRRIIEDDLLALGQCLHQLLATSDVILTRHRKNKDYSEWNKKAKEAQETLKGTRVKLRYGLWGIDDQINDLTRLPDWLHVVMCDMRVARALLNSANNLKNAIDAVILYVYRSGNPPQWHQVMLVKQMARAYRDIFYNFSNNRPIQPNVILQRIAIVRKNPGLFKKYRITNDHLLSGKVIFEKNKEFEKRRNILINELNSLNSNIEINNQVAREWVAKTDIRIIHSQISNDYLGKLYVSKNGVVRFLLLAMISVGVFFNEKIGNIHDAINNRIKGRYVKGCVDSKRGWQPWQARIYA